jgi:pimeloyl-ACP methyl ester carboxylesterase
VVEDRDSITLKDGRTLAFARAGAQDGWPVLVMEGPGSQVTTALGAAAAERCGVRLIAVDRPGFGASSPLPGRTPLHWPADVAQLVDTLGFRHFGILAVSGGTPYAFATARRLPERARGLAVVAGMASLHLPGTTAGMGIANRVGMLAARWSPALMVRGARMLHQQALKDPAGAARRLLGTRPEDAFVLEDPERARIIEASMQQMWAAPETWGAEMALLARPWDGGLHRLQVPTRLWYGARDTVHPPGMGKALALRIPKAQLTVVPDASSFTFLVEPDAMLRWLASAR